MSSSKAMADTEEYFPRGGKKPVVQKFTKSSNFLGAPEREQKKKKKPKARPEPDDDGYLSDEARKTESGKNLAVGLGYMTAKPGMVILGRVRQVLETKMHISLPGVMVGTVMACHVSEPYNKHLEAYVNDLVDKVRELPDMFSPGQYVAVKVLEVKGRSLMLSLMPQHLYDGRRKDDFTSGFLLQAAVSSVEDHGYVMDVGVPNVRAFMAKKDTNPEIELDTGMVTWCCVTSSTEASISVSSTLDALRAGLQRKTAALLPGANVRFTVHKPLDNGIEGRVLGDQAGYVLQQHADRVDGKKPAIGQKFNARVLYVMPTRNTPFLTMRDIFATSRPDLAEEQKLKEGDIVKEAQVIKIVGRSIRFKLGKGSIGVMSGKRVRIDEDLTDDQVLAKMYPIGSTHKVRVLSYNLSDYTYSISDQAAVLNEKYFTMSQLTVGEVVTATVKSVSDGGAVLNVGRFTGSVPHAHMTDAGIFIDPKKGNNSALIKKKFKVGQEVRARVLSVDASKQLLFLTLKPSLLSSDLEILKSYAEAVVGRQYTGCIKHIKEDYILVSFFNLVVAFVPKKFISKEPIENLIDAFHIGQIVKCTIVNVNAEARKMTGSFITEPFIEDPNRLQRKQRIHNDAPKKKRKADDEDYEAPKKKKNRKDVAKEIDNDEAEGRKKKDKKHKNDQEIQEEATNVKDRKRKKDKKPSVSEESDAIETDIHTEEEVLTPIDQGLVDLSDCVTEKQYKKRIVSLIKSLQAKSLRMEKINKKIETLEEKGLNAKNKKFHTAMHTEKLVIEERIKKLVEVLTTAQEKLQEISGPEESDHEEKKKDEIEEVNNPTSSKKDKGKKKDKNSKTDDGQKPTDNKKGEEKKKVKSKEIKVVEDLEPVLDVPSAKDFWSASADSLAKNVQEEESSSSDEEEKDQPKKKRKKLTVAEKVAKAREEEDRLRAMEARAIESEHQPRSSDQFERALLANPGCSQLWIAYMAFHLQATEIEKARAVGRKALNTIPFRDEHERRNVCLALLNCEHRFGTKETQQKTLEDAVQTNEPYLIHSALLDILLETGKQQELSSLVDLMMRKYRRQPDMYIKCGGACYKAGLVEKAKQVMQKAVAVLEKKEHVSVLVQFALMERSSGAPERAEALFEQVLAVYPARTDVCSVYVDMLVKSGDIAPVRQVMERMTSHKLPARKMKTLFKKWIEVEEKIGDKDQVEVIRQRAAEYIDKAKF